MTSAVETAVAPRTWVITAATLVIGVVLLSLSFSSPQGSARFYACSLALAAVWIVGSRLVGPLRLLGPAPSDPIGPLRWIRRVALPVGAGLALAGLFVLGALIVRLIPALDPLLDGVFGFADRGALGLVVAVTLINAGAEELFFRGAVWRVAPERGRLLLTTAIYAAATLASLNLLLVFAAVLVGLVAGRLRAVSGGVLAPVLAHLAWSSVMLLAVPPLVR